MTEKANRLLDQMLSDEFHAVRSRLHQKCGVYLIYDYDQIEYVGMSKNLAGRCIDSITERGLSRCPTVLVGFLVTANTTDAAILELATIAELQPPRNRQDFRSAFTGEIRVEYEKIDAVGVFDQDKMYELIQAEREGVDDVLPHDYAPSPEEMWREKNAFTDNPFSTEEGVW